MFAFEIDNTAVSPRQLGRLVQSSLDATVTQGPQGFFAREDWRLQFTYKGVTFEVWEPFGDNSRYWVGPAGEEPKRVDAIDDVHSAFVQHEPSALRSLLSLVGA